MFASQRLTNDANLRALQATLFEGPLPDNATLTSALEIIHQHPDLPADLVNLEQVINVTLTTDPVTQNAPDTIDGTAPESEPTQLSQGIHPLHR